MTQRVAIYARLSGTQPELLYFLQQAVESRGSIVVSTHVDDNQRAGRGRYSEWRAVLANLDARNEIALPSAGDIPGKTVIDLLKILGILRDHGVGMYVHAEQIDTASGGFALFDLIRAYRRAKLSQAIRNWQAKALAAGKRIGRPTVPRGIVTRIQAALTEGGGIRPTARRFNVSPASVFNIRRTMAATQCTS